MLFVLILFVNCGNIVGSFEVWFFFGFGFKEGMFMWFGKIEVICCKKKFNKIMEMNWEKVFIWNMKY